jgi:hypothetical protein
MLGPDLVLGKWSAEAVQHCLPQTSPDSPLHFVLQRVAPPL